MPAARYRYRIEPNAEQHQTLARTFGCARYTFNWALGMKQEAFRERGEKLSYVDTSKRLTALKKEDATSWLSEVSSVPLQQALRHLDKAYTAFFQGRSRFPRFKAKRHQQSVTYTVQGFSVKNSGTAGQPLVTLAKTRTPLRIRWSRPLPSAPSSVTVIQEPDGRYYVSFVVSVEPTPLPKTKREGTHVRACGIDLGINDVVVTSDGWHSGNPKHLRRAQDHLALEQRRLAKKVKGSRNRDKQRRRVAKLHAKVRNQRADFLHQMSTRLVRRYDVLYAESLNVKGMVRNHSLAKSISDAGWSGLVGMLRYKCEWYGKTLVQIDRWYPSSKTCSALIGDQRCSYTMETLPLGVRRWTCPGCYAEHDRDENAAKNIRGVGHTLLASGDDGRPALALVSGGGCP